MPSPVRPHGTPPPSRNFSHPHRQRAPTLSPEQDQYSSHMAPNESRHMLPLSSRIFSRSTSNLNLHSERHSREDFDLSYSSLRRPGTAHTATSSYSTPDLTATALPQYHPPVPQIPQQFGGPGPAQINPPSLWRIVKSPPQSPTKSAQSGKGSSWRRLKVKVKRVFSFGRQRKCNSVQNEGGRGPMVIGEPYNFEHKETFGHQPLRTAGTTVVGATTLVGGNNGESWGVSMGHSLGGGLADRANAGYGGGAGVIGGGLGGRAVYRGLGNLDVDGTAVSDDGDSTWEDYEATRLFTPNQNNLGQRA